MSAPPADTMAGASSWSASRKRSRANSAGEWRVVNGALDTAAPEPALGERTMLVFPGQGAQYVGMGRRAYETSAHARRLFARADDVLGLALSRICFTGP